MALIVSLILFLVIHLFVMTLTGSLLNFYNIPSLILIIPTSLLFGWATTSFTAVKNAILLPFKDSENIQSESIHDALNFLHTTGQCAIFLGIGAFFMALISAGSNLPVIHERGAKGIGDAIVIACLAPMYSAYLKLITFLFARAIEGRYREKS